MLFRHQRAQALRPFDERNAVGEGVLDTQLISVLRLLEPIKIEMPYRDSGNGVVNFDQGEGWAWDLPGTAKRADEGTGKGRLAAPQRPTQADHVALTRAPGKIGSKGASCRFIRQVNGERCGSGHAPLLGRPAAAPQPCAPATPPPSYGLHMSEQAAMVKTVQQTDVVIVGAGPVGLFAVFECGMLGLKCHVIDALAAPGGQCSALYPEKPIYDIPGYPTIEASELVRKLEEQAAPFGPHYHLDQQVETLQKRADGRFRVETSRGAAIEAKAVIIAAGVGAFGPNRPPLAGIEAYEGKSIFYLVTRREAFRDQRIVIAGGGDSAVDWAISLADIAAKVMVVHRRPKFRAAPESAARLDALAQSGRVELVIPYQLHALEGADGKLAAVTVADLKGETKRLPADILLPFFGLSMNLGPITQWGLALDHHHIVVAPPTCMTSIEGIFAIGDIARYPGKLKLILSGFAEAALAAHAIHPLVHPGEALHFEYSTTKGVPGKIS